MTVYKDVKNILYNMKWLTFILLFTMSAFALGESLLRSAARRRLNDDITLTVTALDAGAVRLTGPWWGWDPNGGPEAIDNYDGTWSVTLTPGEDMQYLWVVDGTQENLIDNAGNGECTAKIGEVGGDGSLITDYANWANRVWVLGSGDAADTYDSCAGNGPDSGNDDIEGCTDDTASNYLDAATLDDGSCEYPPAPVPTAPTPTEAAEDVLSVFSTTYGNLDGTNFNPDWGQATSVDSTGDNLVYTDLTYQGTTFASQLNVSPYKYLNIDYYVVQSTSLNFFLISSGPGEETSVALDVSTLNEWVNVQIPLSSYSSVVDLAAVIQFKVFKVDGNGDVQFNNIYFGGQVEVIEGCTDPDAFNYNPDATTQSDDSCAYGVDVTFQVNMAGQDTSNGVSVAGGAIFGQAGVEMSDDNGDGIYTVTAELEQNTYVNFKYRATTASTWDSQEEVPADCGVGDWLDRQVSVGNAEIVLDVVAYGSCTAAPYVPLNTPEIPPAPAPTEAAEDVLSVFSKTYGNLAGTKFNPNWGQATSVEVGDNLVYTNLNYQGTQFATQDVSGYTYLHVSYYVVQSDSLNFYLVSSGPGEETSVALDVSTLNEWVNVQIPLSSYSSVVDLVDVGQFKVDGNGQVAFNNLYFTNTAHDSGSSDDQPGNDGDDGSDTDPVTTTTYCATEVTHFNIADHPGSILLTVENSGPDSMTVTATSVTDDFTDTSVTELIIESVQGGGSASTPTIAGGVATAEITWATDTMPTTTSFTMLWSDEASPDNQMVFAGDGTDGLGNIDTSNVCPGGDDGGSDDSGDPVTSTVNIQVSMDSGYTPRIGFNNEWSFCGCSNNPSFTNIGDDTYTVSVPVNQQYKIGRIDENGDLSIEQVEVTDDACTVPESGDVRRVASDSCNSITPTFAAADDSGSGDPNYTVEDGIQFTEAFGDTTIDDGPTFTFPSAAETWGGFVNMNTALYPITVAEDSVITFTGSVPTGDDVDVRFRFEANPHPDTEPSFNTETVTVSGADAATYSINVPSQGANTFNSFLMYLITPDVGVSVTDVAISAGTEGCTDATADNYNAAATTDDGSCLHTTDVDCVGAWSECSAECESGSERTFEITTEPSGTGTPCPTGDDAPDCQDGDGSCVLDQPDQPDQVVSVKGEPIAFVDGTASVTISYDVSNSNAALTGLGLRVHYDSSVLTFSSASDEIQTELLVPPTLADDTDDFDNDPSTDKYVSVAWASLFGNWPGALPQDLVTLNFDVAADVTAETTPITFSWTSKAAGYDFDGTAYNMPILPGSWDFDEDGVGDALTDGLMLLRYTFGLTGNAVTDGAIASDSPLTEAEVEAKLAYAATDGHFGDIDGNGLCDALTDGLMLLRYMFGLTGDNLIDGAVDEAAATRKTAADIEAYIASLMP